MNILIVEDYPTNRKLLRAQLESRGHSVVDAPDGAEALQILGEASFDAVISDILMPNMDGFRLCHEIRRDPQLAGLPFVLYTSSYNSPADRELARTVGADGFITKLAPIEELLAAVEQACRRSRNEPPPVRSEHDENYVLKRYSEALVRKLEEKNAELEQALTEVQRSHRKILQFNADLEARVEQRTRELSQANRDLEAFSYSISHDLRSPLRRIDAFARIVAEHGSGVLDEEGTFALEAILKSTQDLSGLIDGLLAFARTGRVEMERSVVCTNGLIDDVLLGLNGELTGRSILLDRQPLPDVRGDPTLLRQVFVNLLDNAVKYTRGRDPARIRVAHEATEGDVVVLCVQDNGVGFDGDRADKLFGVFHRLHRADEFEGTGIGLAIVRRIVERHGGRVWAESHPGQGASFFLTLHAVPRS